MSIPDTLIHLLSSVEKGADADFEACSHDQVQAEWIRHLVLGLSWPIEVHEWWKKKDAAHIIPEGGDSVPIGRRGLRIHGAKVIGSLDLSGCGSTQAPLPALTFKSCSFEGGVDQTPSIDLSNASLCGLDLEDSRFRYLCGVGMTVAGSVNLSGIHPFDDNDRALCWCKLSLCTINGDLMADRVKTCAPDSTTSTQRKIEQFSELNEFENYSDQNWALNIYGSRIGGSVIIREQSLLKGGLLMDNSRVAGDVSLHGVTVVSLQNRSIQNRFIAIGMDRARIDGSLTFAGGLKCHGVLWLYLCEVGGSLDIGETYLAGNKLAKAELAAALYAKGLFVRGWFSMSRVTTDSSLLVEGARIGGNLIVEDVHVNPARLWLSNGGEWVAFSASGVCVEGAIRLKSNEFNGCLDLTGARCVTLQDERSGYGKPTTIIRIDGFRYERIEGLAVSFKVEDRLDWWLPRDKDEDKDYRPQPYVQLAQVLANHGWDAHVREVLFHKAKQEAMRTWKDKLGDKITGSVFNQPLEGTKWCGRRLFYYFLVCPFRFFFEFGLSPTKAVSTVIASIVVGWAMFALMDFFNVLVVAQTPVTTIVHADDADPHKYKFASTFVNKSLPRNELESVNGSASVQNPISRSLSTPVKDSAPMNKSIPVEGRVPTQKPVTVKGAPPVIIPAPAKDVASVVGLKPIQQQVSANVPAVKEERQGKDYSDSDVPCRDTIRLLVYAVDVFIPLVDLREQGKCDIDKAEGSNLPDELITTFRLMKALYAIVGWLVTGAAVVTISGVMRHRVLRD